MLTCAHCGRTLSPQTAEFCWWCLADLCRSCWENYGHCGHAGAELVNITGRLNGLRHLIRTP